MYESHYRHPKEWYVGKTIRIVRMDGEKNYDGRIGVCNYTDDLGQLHGSWGGLAIQDRDEFEVIEDGKVVEENP